MNIGLYFGSFNPIHHGHLIVASYILNRKLVDQVWFVVSPLNPFKQKKDLINEYTRLGLVRIAIEGEINMRAIDVEFKMPKPSYTIDTLKKLNEIYPEHVFTIIVGSDSYENIERWKEGSEILDKNDIIIYRRLGHSCTSKSDRHLNLIDSPQIQISSTTIRQMIKSDQSIRYLLPDAVIEEIEKGSIYRN
jgi:nicotinate-nucleotide adenylyltransferase